MNFDPNAHRLVRSWIKAHVYFIREVVHRLQSVTDGPIGQPFGDEDHEYIITSEGIGYHVEYDVDMNNGLIKFNAVPGRFVASSTGQIWVDGKHRIHLEIQRKYDQGEMSHI